MENSNYFLGRREDDWMSGRAYSITFIVTQDCNLRCKYCYEVNKNSKNKMTFDVAKQAIDYILSNPQIFKQKGCVFDFIGGEPLLEIDLIDKICDYIKLRLYKEDHEWFSNMRFTITTNGTLYNDEKVQKFIKKNKDILHIAVTIDGIKEKHDLNRVYADGRGSYEDVAKNIPLWIKQFPNAGTKVTFSSPDLKYLKDSIIHLWNMGIKTVPANVVYEDVWKPGDDLIFENQLKELADYVIENKLWDSYNTTLFEEYIGRPIEGEMLKENHCGSGNMLAIDSKGNFFPCLRYAEFSLGKKPQYIIGNIKDGFNFDKIRPFAEVNYESQSDEECLNCGVATGCGYCQALNYDTLGTNFKRVKHICKMHKARCRANEYYWGRVREELGVVRNVDPCKNYLYFITDDNCVEYCNYYSLKEENLMPEDVIKKGLEFAERNLYQPVILNSKNNKNIINFNKYSILDRTEIYENGTDFSQNNKDKFEVVNSSNINKEVKGNICVLSLDANEIDKLYEYTKLLFGKCDRINFNLKYSDKKLDLKLYEEQLSKVSELIYETIEEKYVLKQFNKLTDDFFNKSMDNCGAGEHNFALAPNGKIYICPRAYFENKDNYIGDLENGINQEEISIYKFKNSRGCKDCTTYHCDRCVCLNEKFTNEANIPSFIQCSIGNLEKRISGELAKKVNALGYGIIDKDSKVLEDVKNDIEEKFAKLPYTASYFNEI